MTRPSTLNSDELVVVLGAGATRGCSFVDGSVASCLPPLDGDFFTQLQRVPDEKHRAVVTALMEDMVALYGYNFNATLETTFATVEHTLRMLRTTGTSRIRDKEQLENTRDRLMTAIAIALESALVDRNTDGHATHVAKDCVYHRKLVEKVLRQGDHVISFNYDCVIDYALKRYGSGKWNPEYAYGFGTDYRRVELKGVESWQTSEASAEEATVRVHKLHGSLHFRFDEPSSKSRKSPSVRLKDRPYTKQRGVPRFSIIPPESNKAYDKGFYAGLWKNAAEAVASAKHIVFLGYSFPVSDLHASALFRTSISETALKSLIVVNPDNEARRRTREVLQRGMSKSTRVVSFTSWSEFLATEVSAWRG